MQRYTNLQISQKISIPNITQPPNTPVRFNHKRKKTKINLSERSANNTQLNTIDVSELYNNSVQFQQSSLSSDKGTPGVGQYEISAPIIKPSYQTYQKSDQVILVKINHVGGTSSFRSGAERLNHSIYTPNLSPGPGSYETYNRQQHPINSSYHENYDIIQELLRSSRQKMESIPNYKIGVPRPGMEYNGMPKHLQQMYLNIKRKKQESSVVKSLPLEKLIRMRKRTQRLPIVGKEPHQSIQEREQTSPTQKMTQTLHRLDDQIRKQKKRTQKIKAILKNPKANTSKTIDSGYIQHSSMQKTKQQLFNKNMINMLFERKPK